MAREREPKEKKGKAAHGVAVAVCFLELAVFAVVLGLCAAGALSALKKEPAPSSELSSQAELTQTTALSAETTETARFKPAASRTEKTVTIAPGTLLTCKGAALVQVGETEDLLLAEQNADTRLYPASLTKVMSMLTFLEVVDESRLDDILVMEQSVLDLAHSQNASCAGFAAGESCRVRELLYAMMLASGADAALSLADYACGSEAAFVEKMNALASEMGLSGTHFQNCTGLHDENHYSTARDQALILSAALENPLCVELMSAPARTTAATAQHPDGILLRSTTLTRFEDTKLSEAGVSLTLAGGKTGYTDEAGQCLLSWSESPGGTRYISVILGCDAEKPMDVVYDTVSLLQLAEKPLAEVTRYIPPQETTDVSGGEGSQTSVTRSTPPEGTASAEQAGGEEES